MTAMDLHHCPGPETLASFVEGSLPRAEVATVVRHLQGCADCRDIVGDVVEFQREDPDTETAEPAPLRPRRWWIAAAAAAALVLVIYPMVMAYRDRSGLRELADVAPKTQRAVEPRVASMPWAKYEVMRSGNNPSQNEQRRLEAKAGEVLDRVRSRNTAAALRTAGVAHLMNGETELAIQKLEGAQQSDPDDEAILNDLAAALIAGRRYKQAIEVTGQVLARNSSSAAAQFNRAVAFEKLGDAAAARREWSRYLTLDKQSPWATEAGGRLRDLEQ